ncbi:MAG TPA: tripartite tricarboxylate transporter substrate binding protein [Burkholderiales bacterium]|nr:tripartite tricarboxylate transporter substrate binding protein [Burkholderiales bacterium]
MQLRLRKILLSALAAASIAPSLCAAAQPGTPNYPDRPVRVIVNVSPGGGVDAVARVLSQHLHETWKQPFVVDNRVGAGGSIGVELVAKATPDGYTLLVCSSGVVTNAAARPGSYDPVQDLTAITSLTAAPYLLLTSSSLQVSTVKDLIALAKAKPGSVSFGSSGTGGILHLSAELLVALSGTRMLHVPFKGVAPAYPAVASGDVHWILGYPTSALPLVKAGRLKAIAVTSTTRSRLLPELPTVHESGVPGYEVIAWFGLFGPARMPANIVARLNAEAKSAMHSPEVVRRTNLQGAEIVSNTPQAFAAEVKAEFTKWRNLVKQSGLKF